MVVVEDKEVKENRHRPTQLAGMVSIYLTAALVCCTCECRNGYASIHMLILRRAAWAEKYIHMYVQGQQSISTRDCGYFVPSASISSEIGQVAHRN